MLINRVHAARQYSRGRQIGVVATSVAAVRDSMEIHLLSALGLSRSPGRFINIRNFINFTNDQHSPLVIKTAEGLNHSSDDRVERRHLMTT